MASESKNYEIAYILSPSIEEGEVLTHAGKLNKLVEEAGGSIKRAEEPRRRRLAYPVEKSKEAYFGWVVFSGVPEKMADLKKKISSDKKLLRYQIVEEIEAPIAPPRLRTIPYKPAAPRPKAIPRETPKTDEKLDLEALDKKLEEILGK